MSASKADLRKTGISVVAIESAAVRDLEARINADFVAACEYMLACKGRIVVTGMGKSGHIGNKIAATLASTGSPAFFVHPGEASHGDLGMITASDVVLALSNSGETNEIVTILPLIKRMHAPLISMTGNPDSTLAREADVNLDVSVAKEACPLDLAPTASTTAALVMVTSKDSSRRWIVSVTSLPAGPLTEDVTSSTVQPKMDSPSTATMTSSRCSPASSAGAPVIVETMRMRQVSEIRPHCLLSPGMVSSSGETRAPIPSICPCCSSWSRSRAWESRYPEFGSKAKRAKPATIASAASKLSSASAAATSQTWAKPSVGVTHRSSSVLSAPSSSASPSEAAAIRALSSMAST
jgi:D-arabinose 5-phosphate isomerase GutQ